MTAFIKNASKELSKEANTLASMASLCHRGSPMRLQFMTRYHIHMVASKALLEDYHYLDVFHQELKEIGQAYGLKDGVLSYFDYLTLNGDRRSKAELKSLKDEFISEIDKRIDAWHRQMETVGNTRETVGKD